MDQSSIETACHNIYMETGRLYDQYGKTLGNNNFGYKILYGPPVPNTPILFIGDQPGGKIRDEKLNERQEWPIKCEYVSEPWLLANNLRNMFGIEILGRCVGVNANFFRSPTSKIWKSIPSETRQIFERFCLRQLIVLIELLKPLQIIVTGFSTLNKFGPSVPILTGSKNRVLMKEGKIARWLAVSTLHLSGAHIATADRSAIATAIKRRIDSGSTCAAGRGGLGGEAPF